MVKKDLKISLIHEPFCEPVILIFRVRKKFLKNHEKVSKFFFNYSYDSGKFSNQHNMGRYFYMTQ